MSNRTRCVLSLGVALVATVGASLARAGDAPAGPPPAPPKVPAIANAFLDGLVGSWNVESTTIGGPGKGVQRVRRAVGGSALLVESHISVGGRELYATGVIRLDDGGKTAKYWRIDTLSMSELTSFKGPLAETSFDVTSEAGGVFHLERTADGYTATSKRGDTTFFSSKYTKAPKDVEIDAPNAPKDGPNAAIVG